jgi:hypothetical protein
VHFGGALSSFNRVTEIERILTVRARVVLGQKERECGRITRARAASQLCLCVLYLTNVPWNIGMVISSNKYDPPPPEMIQSTSSATNLACIIGTEKMKNQS